MNSTQEIIDAIFGPRLKVVQQGAAKAAVGNPSREKLLEKIEDVEPDTEFIKERRTARMSFAFTERERNLFTLAFLELKTKRPKGVPKHLMTKDQFCECWLEARGFRPSLEHINTVASQFQVTDPKHPEYLIDSVDFTRACSLDIEEADRVPFAVSFTKEESRRYDGVVELLYFIPFLVLLSFVLITFRALPTAFQVHQAIADNMIDRRFLEPCTGLECSERAQRVLTFREITEKDYFYEWLRVQVTPTLWAGTNTDDGDKTVNNRLLAVGALRIQQIRVDPSNSDRQYRQLFAESVPNASEKEKIQTFFPKSDPALVLYPSGPNSENNDVNDWSTAPFNQHAVQNESPPKYISSGFVHSIENECGGTIRGFVNNYDCDGYFVDLPLNLTKQDVLNAINSLQRLNWIDAGTRFVGIRAVFFQKDYQLFDRVVAGFEIASGGYWVRIVRSNLFRFFTISQQSSGYIVVYLLFLCWLAWNILSFAVELTDATRVSARALGRPLSSAFDHGVVGFLNFIGVLIPRALIKVYIKDGWLVLDSANYAFFILIWFWRASLWTEYQSFDTWQNRFYPNSLERYAGVNNNIDYLESVVIVLSYFRLLKNLRSFAVLRLIFKSLYAASTDLLGMAFTAAVLIVAFALSGFVAYGALVPDFSSVVFALVTVLRFVIGDYDYNSWEDAQEVLSPFFYSLLQILLVIIVLEFITAIIADTFGDLSREQYRADYIRHVIEADLRSILTADIVDAPTRSPIALEIIGFYRTIVSHLTYFYRFFHYYLCAKSEKDMTEEELKEVKRRQYYEDPPVDSALYLLDAADRKPQKLHATLALLVQRVYSGSDEQAGEALFLLYEMLFELESRSDIRAKITRQLLFTLASSHCNTSKLTKTLESASKDLVTALINRLGPNNYPFLVAVGVHLPHAAARLPRVSRFVSLFEAHASWSQAVRNESVVNFESSKALTKLQKLTEAGQQIAERSQQRNDNGDSDDDDSNSGNNNQNSMFSNFVAPFGNKRPSVTSNDSGDQQQQQKTRKLLADPSNVSKKSAVSKQQSEQQVKAEKRNNLKEAKQNLTTEQQQMSLEDTETRIMDSLRFRALFSGINRKHVTALFRNWGKMSTNEKHAAIAVYRQHWVATRKQWMEEGAAGDTVDLDDESALLFGSHPDSNNTTSSVVTNNNNNTAGNNSNNNQSRSSTNNNTTPTNNNKNKTNKTAGASNAAASGSSSSSDSSDDGNNNKNNNNNNDDDEESEIDPDEADGTFDIVKLASDRRTQEPFDPVEFFDIVYENNKYDDLIKLHSDRIYTQGWSDRKRKQFRTFSATYLNDFDPINNRPKEGSQVAKAMKKSLNLITSANAIASTISHHHHHGFRGGVTGADDHQGHKKTSTADALPPPPSHSLLADDDDDDSGGGGAGKSQSQKLTSSRRNFDAVRFLQNKVIPLKAFKAIWKKITNADLSEDFLIKVRQLNEMTGGTSPPTPAPSPNASTANINNNNNASTNTAATDDPDDYVGIDAGHFQRYCVISPECHSKSSIPSHYFKIQHDMMYNTVQLMLYIPFVVFFTLLLVLAQNNLGTFSSVTVRKYATRNFKSPEMREFAKISNTDQWRNWVSQNVFDQFLSTTEGVPYLNFTGLSFLVGGVKIRQLRIEAVQDCGYPPKIGLSDDLVGNSFYQQRKDQYFSSYCIPRWPIGFEETNAMLKNTTGLSEEAVAAFNYQTGSCLGFQDGITGYFTTCNGYTIFIPASKSRSNALTLLDEVMPIWIDASTRALVVDFFTYNYNDNIYIRNLILAETTAGGGWHFSVRQDPFRLFTFSPIGSSSLTWIIIMCCFLIVYIIVTISFIVSTVREVQYIQRRLSCSKLTAFFSAATHSVWWFVELATYLLILGSFCTRFFFMTASPTIGRVYRDVYPDGLISYAEASYAIIIMDAFNTFLVYIRIFFFVRLHGKLNILPKTLEKASGYIVSILIISVMVLIAFALAGHVVYGSTVFSMATVGRSLKTLGLTIFENGDFENWQYDKPIWTTVYYLLFFVTCVLILFNMVTSVLARAYSDAKDERFDSSELRHVSSVDSTILATKDLFPSFVGIFSKELRYRFFYFVRAYERWKEKPNINRKRQIDVLKNPYTFYRFMDESFALVEQGSPRQCGIAAGNLVLTMALLRNADKLTSVLQKRWNRSVAASSKRTGITRLSVFGIERPSLLGYVVSALPSGYFDEVYYWCVQTPMFFLNLSPADSVERLLEGHALWKLSAEKYLELENEGNQVKVKNAEDRDEQLGELVGNLTRSVNTVIGKYRK